MLKNRLFSLLRLALAELPLKKWLPRSKIRIWKIFGEIPRNMFEVCLESFGTQRTLRNHLRTIWEHLKATFRLWQVRSLGWSKTGGEWSPMLEERDRGQSEILQLQGVTHLMVDVLVLPLALVKVLLRLLVRDGPVDVSKYSPECLIPFKSVDK